MNWLRQIAFRFRALFHKGKSDADMAEEMRAHLELRTQRNLAAGMAPEEARFAARRNFGGVEQIKEIAREQRSWRWVDELFGDLRYAFRQLVKAPGFTAVVVLTLALCIGANSAIFSVVHAVLLKPYPWPGSDRLVSIYNTYPLIGLPQVTVSIRDYLDRRAGVPAFEESALYAGENFNLSTNNAPERILGLKVTASLFPLLQTSAALGRTFTEADAQVGATKTVVLSDALWKSRFGGDSTIVGRDIRLNGERFIVVGIMPAGFYFPTPDALLWVPYVFTEAEIRRGYETSLMIGRLKAGATIEQAQRAVDAILRALFERFPENKAFAVSSGFGGLVVGYLDDKVQNVRDMLWLLQAGVAAALLIGCANIANLLLARISTRERELAIRAALGAGRLRIFRQLIVESFMLFLLGGALALLVALGGIHVLGLLQGESIPRGHDVSLTASVLGFTVICTLATGLAFGALSAWSGARGNIAGTIKEAGSRSTVGRRQLWLRSSLVVVEVALSLMLLSAAGLFIRSLQKLHAVHPGFSAENILSAQLVLPATKYKSPADQRAFVDRLLLRARALPGVTDVGIGNSVPFDGGSNFSSYSIENFVPPGGQRPPHARLRSVSPGYFSTLKIPLLRGRPFTDQDTAGREPVIIIDRLLADRYWPGGNPIGKRIKCQAWINNDGFRTIIGVIAPSKTDRLEEDITKETLYFPFAQAPHPYLTVMLKTAGPAGALAASLRSAVAAIDAEQPLYGVKTMEARLDEAMQSRRSPALLLGLFAGISLLLAVLGVYGVLAFAVAQRTPEFCIRVALGATRANIGALVLRQGFPLVILGVLLGLAGYFALSAIIGTLLFGVAPSDRVTLLVASGVLVLAGLAACLIPARRATAVDPMMAMRCE